MPKKKIIFVGSLFAANLRAYMFKQIIENRLTVIKRTNDLRYFTFIDEQTVPVNYIHLSVKPTLNSSFRRTSRKH